MLGIALTATADASAATRLAPVQWKDFDGNTVQLVPWQGEHVTLLAQPGRVRDQGVMDRLVGALDRAWAYYAQATGRRPERGSWDLDGRDTVAEVDTTCGAGCGWLGTEGIQMLPSYFEQLLDDVAQHDTYVQVPFYELGRNFWFWGDQLAFSGPPGDAVVTGFAVWMRFRSMHAAGVAGSPFDGRPFPEFEQRVADLAGQYEGDPSLTFAGTIGSNRSPGAYGGTDFWASLMMQLARRHGDERFVERFWHEASILPAARSLGGTVVNWQRAASYAACADLEPVFSIRWGFPRADGSVQSRPAASAVPEPPGGPCSPFADCVVPAVTGLSVGAATRRIVKRCSLGRVTRKGGARGRTDGVVSAQRPRGGVDAPRGARVSLTIRPSRS